MKPRVNLSFVALMLVAAALLGGSAGHSAQPAEPSTSRIVQAADVASATRLVHAVGGTVTHELGIIRAVGARLTAAQRDRLAGMQGVLHPYEDCRCGSTPWPNQTLTEPAGIDLSVGQE